MATVTLTEAQDRALRAMTRCARCVGSSRTIDEVGYVNTTAAQSLVTLGLARHELSATGAHVFVLTDAGWALIRDDGPDSHPRL